MTEFQKGFLSLIRAALEETQPSLPEDFSFRDAYTVSEAHQILPLIYYGALYVPAFQTHELAGRFFERSCSYISHSASQMESVSRVCKLLEASEIPYVLLKGTLLKELYPSPELRIMGDADILIHVEDYGRIRPLMKMLQGMELPESDHEYAWLLPPRLNIELHKRLIPSYNEDYYAYYGDGWRLAHPASDGSCRFEMSKEDMLIYLFTHFAKHFRDKGAGIKYVVDFYVYRKSYPDLDLTYLEREMRKLRLWDFYLNIMHLVDVWFCDAPSDDKSDYLTSKIFDDGVFGKDANKAVAEGLKLTKSAGSAKSAKRSKILRMAFPKYLSMCSLYPVLKKWPILLPIFWLVRLFDIVFVHRYRIKRRKGELDAMNDENISRYQRELNYVGLDFNFGEDLPPDDPPSADPPETPAKQGSSPD